MITQIHTERGIYFIYFYLPSRKQLKSPFLISLHSSLADLILRWNRNLGGRFDENKGFKDWFSWFWKYGPGDCPRLAHLDRKSVV